MSHFQVAAFDFDGTMTYRDSLLPFLCYSNGTAVTSCQLTLEIPHFTGFMLGLTSRQTVKERILTRCLAGQPLEQVQNLGKAFAKEKLDKLIKPEALARLLWHLSFGHRCILISANLDVYLEPWAKNAGFDDIICSQCEVSPQGTLTGRLQGANCWGPEKLRRLNELLGPREGYTLYAYGDSRGDQELLSIADYAYYCTIPSA